MVSPHGGTLVDRVVSVERSEEIREQLPSSIALDWAHYQDVVNIATGRYSPIEGFQNRNDFLKVVHDMTLEDGTVWPLPIILDVDADEAADLGPGERVGLESPNGEVIGAIDIDEVYKYDKSSTAEHVFGTSDRSHPGVANYFARGDFLVGGSILLFGQQRYNQFDLLPKETRVLFDLHDWNTVVGFQTRNAPHRAHEYIQKTALEGTDGLLIQPKLGDKKAGDYRDDVIMGAYELLMNNYYPDDTVVLSVFPSRMRYAGPREALFDALIRKNQGCTHFVVGHDHAGVEDYYDVLDAHQLVDRVGDIGIVPLFYKRAYYCDRCDGMVSEKVCPHESKYLTYPRGSKIRDLIRSGEQPSERMMRAEISQYLMETDEPFESEEGHAGGEP